MKITAGLRNVICTCVFVAACGRFPYWNYFQPPAYASSSCDLFRWITDEETKQFTASSTPEEIISVVENVCSILPSSLRDACNNFITDYGPRTSISL